MLIPPHFPPTIDIWYACTEERTHYLPVKIIPGCQQDARIMIIGPRCFSVKNSLMYENAIGCEPPTLNNVWCAHCAELS